MTTRRSFAFLLLGLLSCAGPQAAPPGPSAASTVAAHEDPLARFQGPTTDVNAQDPEPPEAARPVIKQENRLYAPWHIEFQSDEACAAFKVDGTHPITRFGRFADVYVPALRDVQLAVLRAPGIRWIDQGNLLMIPPPPPPAEPVAARGTSEPIVRGGLSGLKGKGVTVVVVDSGLDFRHPDFITLDAQGQPVSRLSYFWDTTTSGPGDKAPVTYPNGASVGTVYTRDQLTAELRSPARKIPPLDLNGHGTSCASVAAGNGRAYPDLRYSGVAPEADLIAVRVGGSGGRGLENTYLLGAACAWVDSLLGSKPVVFTCSYGGQFGGRDGAHVLERQLDARFAPEVKGRALCISAGNDGQVKLHAAATLGPLATPGRLEWTVGPDTQGLVQIHFGTGELSDLRWRSVGETLVTPAKTVGNLNAITRQGNLTIAAGPGKYAVELWTNSGKEVAADAYITRSAGTGVCEFTGACVVAGKQVGNPGTTLQAVTVGSYDFNAELWIKGVKQFYGRKQGNAFVPLQAGYLSAYSNPGPRRTGDAVKPDVVAPGQFHTAARGGDVPPKPNELVETSGKYAYFNGTSASTPYVAGLIALMLEKKPSLTVGEIHALLREKATRDKITGATPNAAWGYGKIDLAAAKAILAAVK